MHASYAGPSGGVVTGRFVTAFAVIGALATIRPADRALSAAENPQAGAGQIVGRVVDAASGTPIDDAIVLLGASGTTPPRVLVNGRGQFEFRNVPAGAITITASADGYLDGGTGARTPGGGAVPIQLTAGQRLTDVTVRLWKCAAIGGAIFDESGEPVAGASVRLLRRTVGARRLIRESQTTTDDRGEFRFSSLAPGRYVVAVPSASSSLPVSVADEHAEVLSTGVSALVRGPITAVPLPSEPGFRVGDALLQPLDALARSAPAPGADGRVLVYRTTFYPGVAAVSQAQDVELAAGDDRSGVDITLSLVPTVSVSGSIVAPDEPWANARLRLVPGDAADLGGGAGLETAWALTDDNGRFTFLGVPPGQYTIEGIHGQADQVTAGSEGYSVTGLLAARVKARIAVGDAPVTGVSLTARKSIGASGRVVFDGSSPRPTGSNPKTMVMIDLRPEIEANSDGLPALVTSDGRFSTAAGPGRYWLELESGAAVWTLTSATSNGRDLLKQPLDLEGDVSDIVLTLTDHPAEIAGSIESNGGQKDPLDVLVFPSDYVAAADEGMLTRRSRIVTAESGRFSVKGLPSGNYLVAAISPSEEATWARPDVLRVIAPQATTVSIADHGHATVDLKPVVIR